MLFYYIIAAIIFLILINFKKFEFFNDQPASTLPIIYDTIPQVAPGLYYNWYNPNYNWYNSNYNWYNPIDYWLNPYVYYNWPYGGWAGGGGSGSSGTTIISQNRYGHRHGHRGGHRRGHRHGH